MYLRTNLGWGRDNISSVYSVFQYLSIYSTGRTSSHSIATRLSCAKAGPWAQHKGEQRDEVCCDSPSLPHSLLHCPLHSSDLFLSFLFTTPLISCFSWQQEIREYNRVRSLNEPEMSQPGYFSISLRFSVKAIAKVLASSLNYNNPGCSFLQVNSELRTRPLSYYSSSSDILLWAHSS